MRETMWVVRQIREKEEASGERISDFRWDIAGRFSIQRCSGFKRRKALTVLSIVTMVTLSSLAILITIPKEASAYTPHNPIVISSNADFTPVNGVIGGGGSWDNPYLIEGWDIDASTAVGISISNTDAHFIVNNVYVHSGGTTYRGIYFSSVQNGALNSSVIADNLEGVNVLSSAKVNVTLNEVYGNAGNGVYVTSSQIVKVSSNQVYDNAGYGIYFYYCYPSAIIDSNSVTINAGHGIYLWRCMDVEITKNTVSGNDAHGIYINDTSNITIASNTVDSSTDTGIRLYQSDHARVFNNTLSLNGVGGISISYSPHTDIDSNKVTNGGIAVAFNSDNSNVTSNVISVGNYGIVLASSMNTYIAFNSISQFTNYGIWLASSFGAQGNDNSRIASNNITGNWDGINVWASRKVNITSNNVSANSHCGIYISPPVIDPASTEISIASNIVSGNTDIGIYIGSSSTLIEAKSNIVSGNLDGIYVGGSTAGISITSNNVSNSVQVGIRLDTTTGASIYHNNITNNGVQATDNRGPENSWDNGYPSGGNYWSDYAGVDMYNGPNQDIPGSDGIGDTPYVIDTDSSDRYPFMNPIGKPLNPLSLQAVAGNMRVDLTWLAPAYDGGHPITNYRVYRGTVPGGETFLIEVGSVLTHVDTGLTNGQLYCYEVSARNAVGEGPRSNEACATPARVPNRPRQLNAVAGDSNVSLDWQPPGSDGGAPITNYTIYRGDASGGEVFLVKIGNVLAYLDTDVTNGWTYYYTVTATNVMGESPNSTEASATPASLPSAPLNPSAASGNTQVVLNWNQPSSNGGSPITNYEIYRGTTAGGESYLRQVGNVLTSTDTGLTNGQRYFYKIAARNAIGEGPQSSEVSAIPGLPPGPPTGLTATGGNRQILLTWVPPLNNGAIPISNYVIYRGLASGAETYLTTVGNVTTHTDTSLTNGVTYYYKVSALNDAGEGALSAEASATPMTTPGPPTGVVAMSTLTSVIVEWQAPMDMGGSPVTNYSIYRGISPGGETLEATVGNLLQYTDTNVINGQTYYYVVTAINAVGEGPRSLEVRVTVPDHPSAPLNLLAASGIQVVMLTWDLPLSDGGSLILNYSIYRGTWSGGETLLTTIGVSTAYTDTGLTNGVMYYYRVSAINAVGEGPESNEAMATPGTFPSPPTIVSAVGLDSEIVLTISPPADNGGLPIITYKLFRGTSSGGEIFLADIGTPSKHYDAGLTNGVLYCYELTAVNLVGESNRSDEACATPRALPTEPLNLTASPGDGQVILRWEAPASDGGYAIAAYKVYRSTAPDGEILLISLGNVMTYTDSAVTNGQQYYYKVSATTTVGEGPLSAEASATPMNPPTVPSPPQSLVGVAGNGQVVLTWAPPASDGGSPINNYTVYRGTVSGGEVSIGRMGIILTFTDMGLANGQTYYYQVTAWNVAGESPRSGEASAKPAGTPGQPTGLTAVADSSQSTLTWTAPASDGGSPVTAYVVYRGTASGGESKLATVGNVLTYLDTDVVLGRTYYYRVSAVNAIGEGPQSSEASVTIPPPPNQPPTCSITTPAQGAEISGGAIVGGTAADADGTIVVVEVRVDGGSWMGAYGNGAWSYSLNTELYSNGQHTIEARSYDGTDFSQVASVTVSINNPAEAGLGGQKTSSDAVGIALFVALLVLAILLLFLIFRKRKPQELKVPQEPKEEQPEVPPAEEPSRPEMPPEEIHEEEDIFEEEDPLDDSL